MQGTIFDIKHFAIHDGPGIRQTIFFKGCPLSCWWCHNPESRSSEIISLQKQEIINNEKICSDETIGRIYSIDEIMEIVKKDIVFFEESGGGITLSGGEPLLQYEFSLELLRRCKKLDLHTCVDTTGNISSEKLANIAEHTNLFLYDLKHPDINKHKQYTGVGNTLINSNLFMLDDMGKDIWIRFPLIPGINDDESDLLRLLELLSKLKRRHPISILPYHKIGSQKYSKFGLEYKMEGILEQSELEINEIKKIFTEAGFEVSVGG